MSARIQKFKRVHKVGQPDEGDAIIEMRAKLLEQEHRTVRVILNFLSRKDWHEDDPRRKATVKALVWRVFSPGTIAVGGSFLIGIATLVALVFQTFFLKEQTNALEKQNQQISDQFAAQQAFNDRQWEAVIRQNRIENLRILRDNVDGVPTYPHQTRGDAFSVLVGSYYDGNNDTNNAWPFYDLRHSMLQGVIVTRIARVEGSKKYLDLRYSNFEGSRWIEVDFDNARFEESNFSKAVFEYCDFEDAVFIRGALLDGAVFDYTNLRGSFIAVESADFLQVSNSDMTGAELRGSFRRSFFTNVNFESVIIDANCDFSGATFLNCENIPEAIINRDPSIIIVPKPLNHNFQ